MPITKEQIKDLYKKHSLYYDWFAFIDILLVGNTRKKLLSKAYGKVLEVGAGTGRNLPYYSRKLDLTLVDLTPEMLEKAKKYAARLNKKVTFQVADTEELPFKDNTFDTVVDTLVLCTYPNPIKALKEMARVCKPSGLILLLEHGISDRNLLKKFQYGREERHLKKVGCSLIRNPIKLVREASLDIQESKRSFFGTSYTIVARP